MEKKLLLTAHIHRCFYTLSCMVLMLLVSASAIAQAPAITSQPTSLGACPPVNVVFGVAATNTTSYQWQVDNGGGYVNLSNGGIYSNVNAATMQITGGTTAINGYKYRCIATGPTAPPATSNGATLTVNTAPVITTQPTANTTICSGGNASYTVAATGANLSYQWYGYNGTSYVALTNGGIYSGATSATLNITGIPSGSYIYSYNCGVSNECGGALSGIAYLTVNALPAVTTQPSNTITCAGSIATISVSASGTGLTYQWQKFNGSVWLNLTNSGGYSRVTESGMDIVSTVGMDNSMYRCVVSGACTPSVTSNAATLTVNTPVSIVTQPSATATCPAGNALFSVAATGTNLSYQWQLNTGSGWNNLSNGGVYAGVTTVALALTGVTTAYNSYQYRCVVSGTCSPGGIASNGVGLTVNPTTVITTNPVANTTICSGGNMSYSVAATGANLTYQWYGYNGSTYVALTNGGIYSGATSATLNITGITSTPSAYTYSYFCGVTGTCGGATSGTAYLTVNALPAITTQPANTAVCVGSIATISVIATGTNLTYQWQRFNGSVWLNLSNSGGYARVTESGMDITTTVGMDASMYRCVVSGICTPPATSNAATLTVNTPVAIVTNPSAASACPGGTALFSVAASGSGLTYQWQLNTGSGWNNISNGAVYSGVTTVALGISGLTPAFNNNQYRCVVAGTCSPGGIASNAASLTINPTTVITSHPVANTTVCSGANVSYSVAATGINLTYQWYGYNGSTYVALTNTGFYSGATTATLNITGITPGAFNYSYFCGVTGTCGGATSSTAYLTVNSLPAITSQPVNSTVCAGAITTFSIAATGTNLTFQWQRFNGSVWVNLTNGGGYSRVTESGMDITTNVGMDASSYRCVVSGACTPQQTSNAATLTVNTPVTIVTQPTAMSSCPAGNALFSVAATGTNLSYQWQLNTGSGWNNLSNGGVYAGVTTVALSLTGVTLAYNSNQYRCVVTGTCSPGGIASNGVGLTVYPTTAITTNPASNTTICSGGNMSYTVAAVGANLTYQWYGYNGSTYVALTNTGIYSGATSATLNITGITSAPNATTYSYFCGVTGTCSGATSATAYLTVNALPTITLQPVNTAVCETFNTQLSVSATGTGITFQWQVNPGSGFVNVTNGGIYANATTATLNINGATAAQNNYQYRCVVSGICTPAVTSNTVVLTVNTNPVVTTSPATTTICEGTNGSFTVVATGAGLTYQWQVNNGSTWSNVTNTGIYTNATTATLNLTAATTAVNGYMYRCMVSGSCPAPGSTVTSAAATLNINTAPVITTQPSNSSACPGGSTSFSVVATGAGLTYQWQVNPGSGYVNVTNTGIYTNATTATLNLTGATATQNGYLYRCVINGTCTPSVISNAATFSINALPAITAQPANSTICLNGNTSFSVTATGTGLTYQWQVSTNGTLWNNLSNNSTYSGTTASTLNITAATPAISTQMYRVIVTGACAPAVTSNAATLIVNIPTAINTNPANVTICQSLNTSFSVGATGSGLTYQWQVNPGSGFVNVTNGGVYSGATTTQLTLTGVTPAMTGYQYRCNVTGLCAPLSLTSGTATLTVNSNVVINTQPASSVVICSGSNASFTVAATGTGISYQWYTIVNGNSIALTNTGVYSGVTTATLNITGSTAPTTALSYAYTCVVSGTCASAISSIANLTVNAKPTLTSNPANKTVCDSANNIGFNVSATGTGITFQWQVNTGSGFVNLTNGALISGATSNGLLLSQAYYSMNGFQFRCIVSGACTPSVTSSAATLTVNPLVVPAVTIAENKNDICTGTLVTFTATTVNGGTTPSYQWKVNGANAGTNSATFNTSTLGNGNVVTCQLTSNATCPYPQAVNSNQVQMLVTAYQTPTVTVQSSSGSVECSGVPVTFNAATTFGGSVPSYQWQVNGINVSTDTVSYVTDTLKDNDVVRCILTSSFMCPSPAVVSSPNYPMTINQTTPATVSISNVKDTSTCLGAKVTLTAYYTNSGLNPQFQWVKNGFDMFGETGQKYISTTIQDNDVIRCRFISSAQCVFPVTSDSLQFNVNTPVVPEVNVTVFYAGNNNYTFTAKPINGGTSPTYKWFVNNGATSTTGPTFTTSALKPNDLVYVEMTSDLSCVTTPTANSRSITTGINTQEELISDLKLYPNPNTGRFTISGKFEGTGTENAKITVINALGQLVHSSEIKVISGKVQQEINLHNDTAAGMYILRIELDGKQEIRRFNIAK